MGCPRVIRKGTALQDLYECNLRRDVVCDLGAELEEPLGLLKGLGQRVLVLRVGSESGVR